MADKKILRTRRGGLTQALALGVALAVGMSLGQLGSVGPASAEKPAPQPGVQGEGPQTADRQGATGRGRHGSDIREPGQSARNGGTQHPSDDAAHGREGRKHISNPGQLGPRERGPRRTGRPLAAAPRGAPRGLRERVPDSGGLQSRERRRGHLSLRVRCLKNAPTTVAPSGPRPTTSRGRPIR